KAYQFTKKELNSMPDKFKLIFNKQIRNAHWHNRKDKYFELRCMIDGKSYAGTGKTEQAAVENFIKALYKEEDPNAVTKNIKFENYVNLWLETVKKPTVKETSYNIYKRNIELYLYPVFGNKRLTEIKQLEIQSLINEYRAKNMASTANKIYSYLSAIFDYAVIDGLVKQSPMAKIVVKKTKATHGTALTYEEEKVLLNAIKVKNKDLLFNQGLVILMYTGMRRSELATACIVDGWVIINSAKQHLGDEKIRKVPITPMLEKVLRRIDFEQVKKVKPGGMYYRLRKLLPNHHPHDLRHTFITRCQECGIRRELVSLWAGHAADNSITTTVYTHFDTNTKLQLEEAKKFDYKV
ncbi:MAG: site-specific integrase, partial [Clostridia bacterium]|nr:site-specific integrase [Clostridia bacterium]